MASKPPRHQARAEPQRQILAASQQWSGPLPPPAALEHFNAIIPNGAQRIMSMVEQEQAHRIAMESTAMSAATGDTKRGHLIGGGICVLAILASAVTAYIGAHPSVSIALVGLPVAVVIKAIIDRKSSGA